MIHTKQDLLASDATRKRHADLVASNMFRSLLAVALLEYTKQQSRMAGDPSRGDRIQGAQEFVDVFLGLSGLPTGRVIRDPDNLPPD